MAITCLDNPITIPLSIAETSGVLYTPFFTIPSIDTPIDISLINDKPSTQSNVYLLIDGIGEILLDAVYALPPKYSIGFKIDIASINETTTYQIVNQSCNNQTIISLVVEKQ